METKIWQTSIEHRLKIYGNEDLANIYRKSIEGPSKIYRTSVETRLWRKSIEDLSKIYRRSIENIWKRGSGEHLSKILRKTMEKLLPGRRAPSGLGGNREAKSISRSCGPAVTYDSELDPPTESAKASGLWVCRSGGPATNPPNISNQASKEVGFQFLLVPAKA